MRIEQLIKHFCHWFIKIILVLGLIVSLWLVSKRVSLLAPPSSSLRSPATFWHVASANRTSPSLQKLSTDFKVMFLKNSSLIITACARDVESYLPQFRRNIENIASLFGEYRIFIGESDSRDKTLTYLRQWVEENDRVTIKTYGTLADKMPSRPVRIAYCRNDLLDAARKTDLFRLPKRTFYMPTDADRNTRLDRLTFLSNFDYSTEEWGVMTASQYSGYYDIWALRNDIVNYDCWQIVSHSMVSLMSNNQAIEKYISVHQKPIPSDHPLIPVDSAFGGAAIYQIKYLNRCRYSGHVLHEICEHVPFNLCVSQHGGKFFINPKFQID